MRTALNPRRRLIACVPLAVVAVGTALAIAAGINGSPTPITARPQAATEVTVTTMPPVGRTNSGAGVLQPTVSTGEQGEAVPACTACTPDTPAPETLQHLFTRTTAVGMTIRMYAQSVAAPTQTSPSGTTGTLPADCTPSRVIQAELSDTQAVTQAGGEVFGSAPVAMAIFDSGDWGAAEGSPAAYVIVLAPPAVSWVQVDFDDGGSDAMVPIDGVAVLAAPLAAQATLPPNGQPQGTVTAFAASGSEVASVALGAGGPPLLPRLAGQSFPSLRRCPRLVRSRAMSPQPRR